jgi:hypothetical protein
MIGRQNNTRTSFGRQRSIEIGRSSVLHRCPQSSQFCSGWWKFGAPEEIRTPDPQIRSLYQVIDIIGFSWKCHLRNFEVPAFSPISQNVSRPFTLRRGVPPTICVNVDL